MLCRPATQAGPSMRDGFHYKFWVYILCSRSGTLYTGRTGFFEQRIQQHKYDSIEGFTKKYQVHRLVYYEELSGRADCHFPRKAGQALAPREEDCAGREDQPAVAGPG
jgi:hypothetical protein